MSNLERVKDFSYLRKDTSNGGVVNVDREAFKSHMAAREAAERRIAEQKVNSESIRSMENEINTIKDDMNDIKMMLTQLINKGQ
jgi:hypothetical protein